MFALLLGGASSATQDPTWAESERYMYLLLGCGILLTLIVFGFFVFILTRKER